MMEKLPVEMLYEPHMVDEPAPKITYARKREARRARLRERRDRERAESAARHEQRLVSGRAKLEKQRRITLKCLACAKPMSVKVHRESPIVKCPHCGRDQDVSVFLKGSR